MMRVKPGKIPFSDGLPARIEVERTVSAVRTCGALKAQKGQDNADTS
ncbi:MULTISPECIES: hypothetical protein [Asticcacaulis]|nr:MULTISPECIES: hypothetical protein [Asticcacaulis]MBP2157896.1 hypothetical protein [Asticcacaulis solisilvae]MDR6798941.1 hypothetical protein [Asticcacaulis sp. BE141]